MERSDYWRIVAKCWDKENLVWWPNNLAARVGSIVEERAVNYGGRHLPLETYLEVPTFLRQGRRLAL